MQHNPNSAVNTFRSALGIDQIGTMTSKVTMYANRYNWEKALLLSVRCRGTEHRCLNSCVLCMNMAAYTLQRPVRVNRVRGLTATGTSITVRKTSTAGHIHSKKRECILP